MAASANLRSLRRALEGLALFQDVFADPIGSAVRALVAEPSPAPAGRFIALLIEEAELYPEDLVGNPWQNHLLDRLLFSENAFSRKAERAPLERMSEGLLRQTRRELAILQVLFREGSAILAEQAYGSLGEAMSDGWSGFQALGGGPAIHSPEARAFKRRLEESNDWPSLAHDLARSYVASGVGIFGRFRAFRWVRMGERGALVGVDRPDP